MLLAPLTWKFGVDVFTMKIMTATCLCMVLIALINTAVSFRSTGLSRKSLKSLQGESTDEDRALDSYSKRVRHFINLTNGMEAIPSILENEAIPLSEINYIRIQSTHCESR